MCGLLGASGTFDPKVIAALGCLNASRGTDSAGVGWESPQGLNYKKQAVHPHIAFSIQLHDEIDKAAQAGNIIGHTRQATHGEKTSDNAHPFLDDNILFAHNGVIQNHEKFGKYDVDSQCLIHGIKKRDFSDYEGSIALLWLQEGALYCFRNGNPLYRGVIGKTIYLASDDDHLKAVGCQNVRELSEHHLYKIANGNIVESKKIPSNKPKIVTYYHGHDNYHSVWNRDDDEKPQSKPGKKVICECGHKGKAHRKNGEYSKKYGCYAEMNKSLCPCMEFKKRENGNREHKKTVILLPEKKIEIVATNTNLCVCRHGLLRHSMRGSSNVCDVVQCQCMSYRRLEANHEPNKAWDAKLGIPLNALCDCKHELEYHKNEYRKCHVSGCNCGWFWPVSVYHQQRINANMGESYFV